MKEKSWLESWLERVLPKRKLRTPQNEPPEKRFDDWWSEARKKDRDAAEEAIQRARERENDFWNWD
jgi:hypothetical protein